MDQESKEFERLLAASSLGEVAKKSRRQKKNHFGDCMPDEDNRCTWCNRRMAKSNVSEPEPHRTELEESYNAFWNPYDSDLGYPWSLEYKRRGPVYEWSS